MQGERQQDSHEWYVHIIDKLHECEKPSYDSQGVCRCFIHKAFFGRTRQEIMCNKCGFVSRTQEQMLYLTLDFPKQLTTKKKGETDATAGGGSAAPPAIPTMAACLEDLTGLENLSDDSYSCRGCDKKGRMTKTIRIRKLPAILCMQVNRFQNEVRGGNVVQKKIKGRVQYPLEIDMRPYTTKGGKSTRRTAKELDKDRKDGTRAGDEGNDSDGDRFLYELESVIVHEGKAIEQGHYFAFCRGAASTLNTASSATAPSTNQAQTTTSSSTTHTTSNPTSKREWYMFNDAKVTVAAEPLVLEQEAYLLFYSLKRICGPGSMAGDNTGDTSNPGVANNT